MITRTRIRLATAMTVLALGPIAACGAVVAPTDVTDGPAPSLTAAVPSPTTDTTRVPSGTRAPSQTPTATPSRTPAPAPSRTHTSAPEPRTGVTTRQLLRGSDFTRHGWGRATVTRAFEGDAGLDLTRCSSTSAADADGYVGLVAWLYEGSQTHGVEMAAGFTTESDASDYAAAYATVLTQRCRAVLGDDWQVLKAIPSTPRGASSAGTWVIREQTGSGPVLRVISVITAGRRVAVLHLSSTTSDPSTTVDLPGLLQAATHRLVSA